MKRRGKKKPLFDSSLNTRNINDFKMSGLGEWIRFYGAIRHFRK